MIRNLSDEAISSLTSNNKYIFNNLLICLCLLIFIIILIVCISKNNKKINIKFLFMLFSYHTAMSIGYYYWGWPHVDAATYYGWAWWSNSISDFTGVRGNLISLILYPFVSYLHMSFFSGFMMYNVIGYVGMIVFYLTMMSYVVGNEKGERLLNRLIFLPGLSFWTSCIGKESVQFLAINVLIFSLVNINKRYIWLFLSLILIMLVRPHVFMMTLMALFTALLISTRDFPFYKKILVVLFLLLLISPGYHLFLDQTKLEELDLPTAEEYMQGRGANWGGGSGIDIQNYNIFFKIITFLFRPLFFDAHNISTFISSCENLIYLIMAIQLINKSFVGYLKNNRNNFIMFNLFYFLIVAFFLSYTEGNLGTAVRHKTVIMTSFLSIYLLYQAKQYEGIKSTRLTLIKKNMVKS